MPVDEDSFFDDLLAATPELSGVYADHVDFNRELLGYLALGDMTQHVLYGFRRDHESCDGDVLRRYTEFLEFSFDRYGEVVHDMIIQSFLEFVEGLTIESPATYSIIYRLLGPKLRDALATSPP